MTSDIVKDAGIRKVLTGDSSAQKKDDDTLYTKGKLSSFESTFTSAERRVLSYVWGEDKQ